MNDLAEGSLTGEQEQPVQSLTNDNQPAADGSWEDALPVDKQPTVLQKSPSSMPPTWDQAVKQKLPTWDDAVKQGGPSAIELTRNALNAQEYNGEGNYTMSPAVKQFLSGTSLGRVMNAFNYNFSDQVGSAADLGFTKGSEFESLFHKAGILKDVADNDNSIVSAVTDGPVRMAAQVLDATMKTTMGAISGTGAALRQIGGTPSVDDGIIRKLGGALTGGIGEILEAVPEGFGTEFAGGAHAPHKFTPNDFHEAKSAGVMDGESVYMGTKEATPEQREAQTASAEQVPLPQTEIQTQAVHGTVAPDIHQAARNIAPEVFNEYDRLSTTRDTLSGWIRDFAEKRQADAETNAPHQDEISELENKLDDANARYKKIYQARIDDLKEKQDNFIQEQISQDTPELDAVRKKYQEIDYRMRDLSPDVSSAYRQAQERVPNTETIEPQTSQADVSNQPEAKEVPVLDGSGETKAPKELNLNESDKLSISDVAAKPIAEQRQSIISDISQKLISVGRPIEEANAAAQLEAARYETLAAQYPKFSAEEWYNRESANIKAGRERAKVLAQGELGQGFVDQSTFGPTGPRDDYFTNLAKKSEKESVNKKSEANENTPNEQKRELAQSARGKIRLATDEDKATITLMKNANASTLIHEKGHEWTDQLLRLSEETDAPQQMKDDAATLRKYGSADENGNIPTRGHERIARGFEHYLMEGTAPSRQLAGVFAKFKQWLTQIYQTVEKLRSPISEDIRDVFDRLLAKNPEKTVVAPDHETGKMMADIHETDAQTTPPEHAAEVRDSIEQEQDLLAKNHSTEAYNALRSADQASEEPAQANSTEPAGPVPATGSTGISPQPTEKQPSSGDIGAEGGGERTEPTTTATAGTGTGTETAGSRENPDSTFGSKQPDLIDKAGNIRLDNLNTPEDINKVIRATAEDNDNFIGARRGVIPAAQQLELADALGMQPSELNFRKIGQAFNAEQILALRKLLIQSAKSVRDFMTRAADGTDQDVLAYAEAKQRHLMIQEHVAAVTAEAGRALGAFRKLEGSQEASALGAFLKQATGKDLFQLKQEAGFGSKLETPEQVSMFMNATKKASFRDMVLEYYINCLISGPITHARYSVGNAINALWTPLVEIPTAAAIGKIREVVTGQEVPNRVYLGEAGAQLMAIFKGSREGLTAGATAFRTGVSPLLPGEHISDNFASVKMNAIPGKIGQVINVPGKSVSAIHSFFKSVRYEQNIHGLAYRTAMNEGLEGTEFDGRVSDLIQNPTEDMMKQSTASSLRELYMSPTEYNSTMGALNRAVNSNLAAKIIVPFMKIGSQITRNAFIERTPLGFLSKDVRENIGSNSAATDMQLGRMGTGVALIGATSLMTLEGMATGDGPSDPNQKRVWLLNHKPNSMQIGDISIPYQGLGHLGMLMRFSANMTETAKAWDASDGDKLAKSFFSLLEGINKSVIDENFMRGVKDMLDAVYHPEEYGGNYVRQFATNWLPFSVGLSQVARQIDPDYREAHTIFEAARSKIPFESESLQPKRDVFGEPIPTSGSVQNYENDPVAQRMDALNMGVGKLNRKILGVPLDDQQYDDFSRISGRMAKMRLNALIGNSGFGNLPQHVQIDTIHKIITDSRKTASSIVMMNNPQIIQQAKDNKMNAIRGTKNP